MTVKLNRTAFTHAKQLITQGRFLFDERDAWSEHRPSAQKKNDFIEQHGFEEYAKWHMGIKPNIPKDGMSSRMEISRMSIAAACFPRRAGRANTSISISKPLPHTCME